MRYFVLIVFILCISSLGIVFAVPPLEKTDVSNPSLVNAFGSPLGNNINLNQQVQVSAEITNNQDVDQEFVYIVQIKNERGVIVSLGFLSGIELAPLQSFSPALSWSTKTSGTYTAEIYVWDNLENQEALSELQTIEIIVS